MKGFSEYRLPHAGFLEVGDAPFAPFPVRLTAGDYSRRSIVGKLAALRAFLWCEGVWSSILRRARVAGSQHKFKRRLRESDSGKPRAILAHVALGRILAISVHRVESFAGENPPASGDL